MPYIDSPVFANCNRFNILIAELYENFGDLAYLIVMPYVGEKFTESCILGPERKADNYPTEISMGKKAKILIGIVNQEQDGESYRTEIKLGGFLNKVIAPVLLDNGNKRGQEVVLLSSREKC